MGEIRGRFIWRKVVLFDGVTQSRLIDFWISWADCFGLTILRRAKARLARVGKDNLCRPARSCLSEATSNYANVDKTEMQRKKVHVTRLPQRKACGFFSKHRRPRKPRTLTQRACRRPTEKDRHFTNVDQDIGH